jgi:cyclic pyranopterin phosphate synthase
MSAILEAAYKAGIRVLHWTGGEPTLRKDLVSLIGRAHGLGFQYQKLTTNGLRLNGLSADLKRNGLNRVNVSLPSVTRKGYQRATGRDALPLVLERIQRAATLFDMVKMNVCLRNTRDGPNPVRHENCWVNWRRTIAGKIFF